jgi:hypothetical protein
MDISITQLYSFLSDKLDRETAENLTAYIEAKNEKTFVDKTDLLKWTVGLFITLALMVIGLYFK